MDKKATIQLRDKTYEIKPGMTVRAAMLKHGIRPEAVIPTRNGELITDDEYVQENDRIRLIAVISGGTQESSKGVPTE
jgi:sulfur carrier protein ThiS